MQRLTPVLAVGRLWLASATMLVVAAAALAQTPQPFPRAGQPPQAPRTEPRPGQPQVSPPPAQTQAPAPPPAAPRTAGPAAADSTAPTAATLGIPIYPSAQFIASYDAGRGQRYYLFGTTGPYSEIVLYYRTQLGDRGDVVFKEPPTHMFTIGRFRAETMAFPPGVTVKDWTWGGSQGYPNPTLGAEPARFPTIIMIVPTPPATAPPAR